MLLPALAWAAGGGDSPTEVSLALYGLAFVTGLGTSLTPCVYPMIPIVVGVFGARDEAVTRRKAFVLASCYVLGMAVVNAALGVGFALAGNAGAAGQLLANPWVVFPVVALYVAMALSMFGLFEIRLPYALQQRLNGVGGAGFGGAFSLGMVGGITAAPCAGPAVVFMLGLVASTGDVVNGMGLMVTYALGFGVLFFAVAVFAMSLPKSGSWMDAVKSIMGIALLVVSFYFLRPVVPAVARFTDITTVWLLASLGITALGFIIGAAHKSFYGPRSEKLQKALGIALATAGLVAAMNWALTPKNPLDWRKTDTAALAEAKTAGKGVIVDFRAEWCAPCKEYEAITFSDPLVHAEIGERFVPVKIDMTDPDEATQAIADRYGAEGLPDVLVLDAEGKELMRFREFVGPTEFLSALKQVEL